MAPTPSDKRQGWDPVGQMPRTVIIRPPSDAYGSSSLRSETHYLVTRPRRRPTTGLGIVIDTGDVYLRYGDIYPRLDRKAWWRKHHRKHSLHRDVPLQGVPRR